MVADCRSISETVSGFVGYASRVEKQLFECHRFTLFHLIDN